MNSYELFIGLRYTRSRQRTRFISVISLISIVGIALGMTVLITVLSVFNGFQREVRTRMLSAVAHIQVSDINERLSDWRAVAEAVKQHPDVKAVAPYVTAQGLLTSGGNVHGAFLRGIVPELEDTVDDLSRNMRTGELSALKPGEFGVILGDALARQLGVVRGDVIVLVAPQGQVTPAGVIPRLRQFTVVGTFNVGHYEIDSTLALIHMEDAQRLYRMGTDVSGVRVKLDDLFSAPRVARELLPLLQPNNTVLDWTKMNATYFRAVDLEKRMMSLLLFFIIAIAAFNLVSSLFMVVKEKNADIAILRTLGASPGGVLRVFLIQGVLIGFVGVLFGIVFGIIGALNVDTIVSFVEHVFGFKFLPQEVYQISDLPSELHAQDVIVTAITAFVLASLATVYPSWRASKVNPAEALRYE
ncbi:MAG: Lipoprotein releasing system, transrane protein LolC/E family [Betaproteobacteria bacterium]|nr:Lipoprotein releasing system, transrane protein LolC/E family [Betaproteobacteria bacterium]